MSLAAAAPALLIGGSLVGGVSSAASARQQNKAIQRSVNAQGKAAGIQIAQLGQRAAIERENRQADVNRLLGAVRAAGAERGVDQTSTLIQSDIVQQAGRTQDLLEVALGNDIAAVRSGYEASAISAQNQTQGTLLSAFRGALGGISAAANILSLGNTISDLGRTGTVPSPYHSTYGNGIDASRFLPPDAAYPGRVRVEPLR